MMINPFDTKAAYVAYEENVYRANFFLKSILWIIWS